MEKWKYNGISLCTSAWNVESVLEGLGKPKARGSNISIPYTHGSKYIKKRLESKTLILAMWVVGNSPSHIRPIGGNLSMGQLDRNIDYLNSLFGKSGQYTLERIMRNGEIREARAEVVDSMDFPTKRPGFAKFTVEFELADPLFYTTSEEVREIDITENEQIAIVENIGTAPTNRMKILLDGPLESPMITNLNTGVWLQYQGSIASGETVEIDTRDYSCTKDGENYIAAIKHGGDMDWLALEAGDNNIKIKNNAVGGKVEFQFYPAFF
jgi:phage-related protein